MKKKSRSLSERFREQARVELLDAALRAFARDGVAEARIDDIAAEAGVSVGTVYNVFGGRSGLVRAALEHSRNRVLADVRTYLEGTNDQPFDARLRRVVHVLVGAMRDNWSTLRVISEAEGPGCPGGDDPTRPPLAVIREIHRQITGLVTDGIACGALTDCDPHVATCALMGAIRTTVDLDLALGLEPPSEARADAIIALFLHGAGRR